MDEKLLKERLEAVRMVVLDVDGVLTDGRVWMTSSGDEMLGFNIRDGMGIVKLMEGGVELAILSGRNSAAAVHRAKALGIKSVLVGIRDKLPELKKLAGEKGVSLEETAYVGDDLNDLEPIKAVGLGAVVADAVPELIEAADITLEKPGGHGAVRQLAEMILKSRGLWP